DGSILSAPFDPLATRQNPEARNTYPPPTEVLAPQSFPSRDAIPPTIPSPQIAYVPTPVNNAAPYPQQPLISQGQDAVSVPRKRRPPIPWFIPIALVALGSLGSVYVGSVVPFPFGLLIAILLTVVNLIVVRRNARSPQPHPGYTPSSINNAVPYQQPSQSSQGQPASLKVPRRSRVLALAVSVIACIFGIVLGNQFVFSQRHYDTVINHFVYDGDQLPPATVPCLLIYGALAFFFGYKWPQGGWKWILWLAAIPAIILPIAALGAPPVNQERLFYFLRLFLPLLLLALFLGVLLGSKLGRRKRVG
ncbi:MAG: hypothetical protein M3362_13715, partial [Acidobacteriota bacterium]|nr:hypothetical protein [Acidobacteriota bacterium]